MAALGPAAALVEFAAGVPSPFLPDRASATTTIAPISTTTSAQAATRMSVTGRRWVGGGYPGVPDTGGPEKGYGAALVWLGHGAPLAGAEIGRASCRERV